MENNGLKIGRDKKGVNTVTHDGFNMIGVGIDEFLAHFSKLDSAEKQALIPQLKALQEEIGNQICENNTRRIAEDKAKERKQNRNMLITKVTGFFGFNR